MLNFEKEVKFSPVPFAIISLLIIFLIYQIGGFILIEIIGKNPNNIRLATILGQFLFLFIPVLVLSKIQFNKLLSISRWRIPSSFEIFLITISTISLTVLMEGYLSLQTLIPLPENIKKLIFELEKIFSEAYKTILSADNFYEQIFVFITIALTPAIFEEILFRGFVLKSFQIKLDSVKAFVLTGIIFGLFHFNFVATIPLVIIGIFFGFLVYKTQTILSSIIAHLTNNTVMVMIYFLFPDSVEPKVEVLGKNEIINILFLMFISFMIFYFSIKNLSYKKESF